MTQQYPGPQNQGQQPYPPQGYPQQPMPQPKKRKAGKIVGFGCLGIVALFVIGGIAASAGGGSDNKSTDNKASGKTSSGSHSSKKDNSTSGGSSDDKAAKTVVFKVWGNAPAGALGNMDITYGSDSDTRQGHWKNGFTATLPLKKGAMYYQVNAQLQGSGDIKCSVTIGGKTKTAHASGGYNICDVQLTSFIGDDWS
jgi:hypothetical protein